MKARRFFVSVLCYAVFFHRQSAGYPGGRGASFIINAVFCSGCARSHSA